METEYSKLKEELNEYRDVNGQSHVNRMKILNNLEEEINYSEHKTDEYSKTLTKTLEILEHLKEPISVIFEKVGCDDEILYKDYTIQGVTENNILGIMGFIEKRISEIAQVLIYFINRCIIYIHMECYLKLLNNVRVNVKEDIVHNHQ